MRKGTDMRLFIAEKRSLAYVIAGALPGPSKNFAHYIECGEGNVVAWCSGHILQAAPPDAYRPEYKYWRLHHLPITPERWIAQPSAPQLVASLRYLLKHATSVVHAGDPDREGQLLVDEVLEFLRYRGPVMRLLINDMTPKAVERAIGGLKPNANFKNLSDAALARQRADWLYGMNMTRLYTLLGKNGGYNRTLSIGRVQTPLLGLIVKRDAQVEQFVPTPYFTVEATFCTADATSFRAAWKPAQARDAVDAGCRVLSPRIAQEISARIAGATGIIADVTEKKHTEAPPLPYSLADLQIDAGQRFGLSAQQVLDACQKLYETYRVATYPRSDCSYLPEGQLHDAPSVLAAIGTEGPHRVATEKADRSLRSKAWDDKKVTAHHAIIPTAKPAPRILMDDTALAVYDLICRRYIAQFYRPFEYAQTSIAVTVEGETFTATGRCVLEADWKELSVSRNSKGDEASLPPVKKGEAVTVTAVSVREKKTQPPKRYTDASLIQAMCNIGSFVTDPFAKKVLSETDGIGTPATRAAIIETLVNRDYVDRRDGVIVSTPTGRSLIHSLPLVATEPDMTARWEAAMRDIQSGAGTLDAFVHCVGVEIAEFVTEAKERGSIAVESTLESAGERPIPKSRRRGRSRLPLI